MKKLFTIFIFSILISSCGDGHFENKVIIRTGPNKPDYSCEYMVDETRTAYNCYNRQTNEFAREVHLGDNDTWEQH